MYKNLSSNLKNNKGFTIIELIAVIVVIGILSAVAAKYAANASDTSATEEIRQADKVNQCIKDSRTSTTYTGLTTEVLINTHCFDGLDMLNAAGDALINAHGGEITIDLVAFNGIDDLAVEVTSEGYGAEQCVKAVQDRIKTASIVGVDGTEVKAQGDNNIQIDAITTACETDSVIPLTWVITR